MYGINKVILNLNLNLPFLTFKKKIGVKKISEGGGGVFKNIFSHFTFYAIFNILKKKKILKSAPSLTG